MRFETVEHLLRLSNVFGDGITAGLRCRLPKVLYPKNIVTNDLINVVCGANDAAVPFVFRTERDGIDMEFDGFSDLFITVRYSRYAYTPNLEGCDPLLSSLIRRCDPDTADLPLFAVGGTGKDNSNVFNGSEFVDVDGCLYRVTGIVDAAYVDATCFYPVSDNHLHGRSKRFDVQLAKDLIEKRLNG
jgi:hypothetical protein